VNENATRPLTRPEAEELFERLSRSASRRRRVRAWVRTATVIGVSIVLVGTLTWATLSLLGLRKNTSPASGNAHLSTYRLQDVRVVYPYVDPRTGEPDETRAGIEGTLYWTSEEYPGVHRCTFTAYGPDGSTVGRDQGEVSALSEGHRTSIPISVSGAAVSGEITCDPTRLDTPVAYEIRDAHVASVLDPQSGELVGARVLYTVVWPEGVELPDYPGTNACTVRFARASGEPVADWRFTLDAPPGQSETPAIGLSDLPGVTSLPEIDELTATVGCVPFTGDSNASPNGAGQETSGAAPSPARDAEFPVIQVCPAVSGDSGPTQAQAGAAEDAAIGFLMGPNASSYLDAAGSENGLFPGSGAPAESVLGSASAATDSLIVSACGTEVARKSWRVLIDDGTSSASLDFYLYLVDTPDGWKVWAKY